MGARLMADTLPRIESGESEYTPQNSEEATYAPKLTKADGKIDFGGRAGDLNRQIRAFDPWPGAFCDYKTLGGRPPRREGWWPVMTELRLRGRPQNLGGQPPDTLRKSGHGRARGWRGAARRERERLRGITIFWHHK